MKPSLYQMHDATLVAIRLNWSERACTFEFAGSPRLPHPFTVTFSEVSDVSIPALHPWGPSVSVLEITVHDGGRYDITMQSGDTITVVASNFAFQRNTPAGAGVSAELGC